MSAHAVFALGFVACVLVVIAAIGRRDAPMTGAAAGCLGAAILGVLAILSGASGDERDRRG
jgi:hypothetical protein